MKNKLATAFTLALLITPALWAQTIRSTRISQIQWTSITTAQEAGMTLAEGSLWYNSDLKCYRYRSATATYCIAGEEANPGLWNNIPVVDGNKFTTTQLAEDDLGSNPGLVLVPSAYTGADPTSISGGISILHLQKGDDSPVKQNVFWEAGQLDIVDQDGWVFQVNNHDYRDNANWSTGASPATSSLMVLGWTTPTTGEFSSADEAKVLELSMEHHNPTLPGVGLVINVNPGVNNVGPIWGQNIGMSNNNFTGHGTIMALEINLGIDASGTFQPDPSGAAHVSGLVLTESSTGGAGKRSTAAINIFGTAAGQNWYHGISINNNDTGADDMAYGLRMQNTIERPIDLLATTGHTQLGSILLPGLTEGGIAFQRNTGSAMRRAFYIATGTDILILRTAGSDLVVQDEDANAIVTFGDNQRVTFTGLGIGGDGGGFKHARIASGTTGGSLHDTANATWTFATAFADTNFTVVCTVDNPTGIPIIADTNNKLATAVTIEIIAGSATAASGTLNCIAVHD